MAAVWDSLIAELQQDRQIIGPHNGNLTSHCILMHHMLLHCFVSNFLQHSFSILRDIEFTY